MKRISIRVGLISLFIAGLTTVFVVWQVRSAAHKAELNQKLADALWFSGGGNIEEIKRLIHEGADPNISTNYSRVHESFADWFRRLLFHRPGPTIMGPGTTPIMVAAEHRDAEFVKELLERGANPNARNRDRETALYLAVVDRDPTSYDASSHVAETTLDSVRGIVRELLIGGADPNAQSGLMDDTPFQRAIHFKDDAIDNLFLQHGAKWNNRDVTNVTALTTAVLHGRTKLVMRMLAGGGNPNEMERHNGYSALELAELNGYHEIAKMLLDRGATVNIQGGTINDSPLMRATRFKESLSLIQRLLDLGARLDAKNNKGETALDLARKRGDNQIIQILESATRKQAAAKVGH